MTLALTSCSGGPSTGASAKATTGTVAAPTSSPAEPATAGAALGARLRSGMARVTSAHVAYRLGPIGASDQDTAMTYELSGTGVEQLSGGQPTAMDVTGRAGPAAQVHVLVIGGVTYRAFPQDVAAAAKPWAVVSPASTAGRYFVSAATEMQKLASPSTWTSVVTRATHVRLPGTETLDGAQVSHYRITVPVPAGTALPGGGAAPTTFSADVWVDGSDRLRRYRQSLTKNGGTMELLVTFSDFGLPVQVAPPPPGQVQQG